MPAPPKTSSLLAVLQQGRLSRAHAERFAAELAALHGSALASRSNVVAGAALGYAGHVGSILSHAFLHEGRMVLERPEPNDRGFDEGGGVAGDVAGVMLELDAFGHTELADFFLATWLLHSGDYDVLETLRAHVARAALLSCEPLAQTPAFRANSTPSLPVIVAKACARVKPKHRPFLVLTHGLSGAGKTTLAGALVGGTGALAVRNDAEAARLRQHGAKLDPGVIATRLEALTVRCITAGWPVIVESCFLDRDNRARFRATAEALGVPFGILVCAAPLSQIAERLERRRSFGSLFHGRDASAEAVQRALLAQIDRTDALDASERAKALTVDTSGPVDTERVTRELLDLVAREDRASSQFSAPAMLAGRDARVSR